MCREVLEEGAGFTLDNLGRQGLYDLHERRAILGLDDFGNVEQRCAAMAEI
jgi:hypothetical protein